MKISQQYYIRVFKKLPFRTFALQSDICILSNPTRFRGSSAQINVTTFNANSILYKFKHRMDTDDNHITKISLPLLDNVLQASDNVHIHEGLVRSWIKLK